MFQNIFRMINGFLSRFPVLGYFSVSDRKDLHKRFIGRNYSVVSYQNGFSILKDSNFLSVNLLPINFKNLVWKDGEGMVYLSVDINGCDEVFFTKDKKQAEGTVEKLKRSMI